MLDRRPSDPEVQRIAEAAFRNYGRMLLDFVRIGSATREEVRERVSHDGKENLDRALERGTGALLAVPHMGSWDMGGAAIGVYGYPTYAVAEVFPGSLNDAIVSTRERFGLKVIPLGRSAVRRILNALAENAVVALLCDLEHGPGVEVEFFGRRAVVPSGPAAFALRTGAPLLPACMYGTADGYHAHIEPPVEYVPTGVQKPDVTGMMQAVIRRFEAFISARPEQWYAFRQVFLPA